MSIAEQIKQKREELNMTQEELAERLDISRQAVSKWESGISEPTGKNRAALAEILGLSDADIKAKTERKGMLIAGWAAAIVLLILSAVLIATGDLGKTEAEKAMEVCFFDKDMNSVAAEANWYNTADILGILIDCEGVWPDEIRMLFTPSGTETIEQTRLMATKCPREQSSVLLSADILWEKSLMGHLYFELHYGKEVVTSELYNVIYDPDM